MAWKHALAKIKQDLKAEPEAPPAPKPKSIPKPDLPARPIEDEDAMFLRAMGRQPAAAPAPRRPGPPQAAPAPVPPPPPPVEEEDFQAAMQDLKGLKSLGRGALRETAVPAHDQAKPAPPITVTPEPAPALTAEPIPVAESPEVEVDFQTAMRGVKALSRGPLPENPKAPAPSPAVKSTPASIPIPALPPAPAPISAPVTAPVQPVGPKLIHLAAGMAIEVDGSLDLRAHSVADARERLRERIQDGRFLGWRTLHLHLGPEPGLHEMLQSCIRGAEAPFILQYAQAPIPMGGSQAWILYFHLA